MVQKLLLGSVAVLATVSGLLLVVAAFVFGDCGAWFGHPGTCPRIPMWDWPVFATAAGGAALLVATWRMSADRIFGTISGAAAVGVLVGLLAVWVTAV